MPSLKTIHQTKETLKSILTLIAAVGLIQTAVRAAEEPAWSLEGKMISADSCGPDCHCIIGGPPDNGLCKFFAMGQVDSTKIPSTAISSIV